MLDLKDIPDNKEIKFSVNVDILGECWLPYESSIFADNIIDIVPLIVKKAGLIVSTPICPFL